jgi:hypothetical protein
MSIWLKKNQKKILTTRLPHVYQTCGCAVNLPHNRTCGEVSLVCVYFFPYNSLSLTLSLSSHSFLTFVFYVNQYFKWSTSDKDLWPWTPFGHVLYWFGWRYSRCTRSQRCFSGILERSGVGRFYDFYWTGQCVFCLGHIVLMWCHIFSLLVQNRVRSATYLWQSLCRTNNMSVIWLFPTSKASPKATSFDRSVCLLTLKHLVSLQVRVRPLVQTEPDLHTADR